MLKSLCRGPVLPVRHSSTWRRTEGSQNCRFDALIANSLACRGTSIASRVRTNPPSAGSRVNVCTPRPTVSTSIVAGPYMPDVVIRLRIRKITERDLWGVQRP